MNRFSDGSAGDADFSVMSARSFVPEDVVDRFVDSLRTDLVTGKGDERYGASRALEQFDGGLPLVIGHPD